jgi:hypothetical protein
MSSSISYKIHHQNVKYMFAVKFECSYFEDTSKCCWWCPNFFVRVKSSGIYSERSKTCRWGHGRYLLYLSLSFLLVSLWRMKGLLILSFTLFAKNFFIQIFYFSIAETFRHEPIEIANHDRPEFLATCVRVCARGRFVVKSFRFFCNKYRILSDSVYMHMNLM